MRDPKRLLSGEGTDLERSLLRAVSAERPTRDLERRMQAGLGLKGFSAAKALSTLTQLVVVAALGVVVSTQSSSPLLRKPAALEASAPVQPLPVAKEVTGISDAKTTVPGAEEGAPAVEVPSGAGRSDAPERPRSVANSQRSGLGASTPGLRDEIKQLDRARGALRGGDARGALSELDRYAQKFPRGDFRQEASVLRIQALEKSGRHGQATTLAREFVNQHPKSPHVDRVQRVSGK